MAVFFGGGGSCERVSRIVLGLELAAAAGAVMKSFSNMAECVLLLIATVEKNVQRWCAWSIFGPGNVNADNGFVLWGDGSQQMPENSISV